jgi:tetratricopeptide (TPR) repeat protein
MRNNTYSELGSVQKQRFDWLPRAAEDATEAIRLAPDHAPAYQTRGAAYERTGEYNRAISDFTEVIQLKPDFATAYFDRGLVYQGQGDQPKAEADFTRAKQLGYDPRNRSPLPPND